MIRFTRIITVIALLLISAPNAFATNADQMLGVTALEWARGGAVVASPVDVPSILYNPAALGELGIKKIGFDLSLGLLNAQRHITTAAKTTESDSEYYLAFGNGVGAKISDNVYFGLAAGGICGLGVDFPSTTLPANASTQIMHLYGGMDG
ncbi:MAG: hypothetical protein L0Y62_01125 [Nitrospirae bacterium]|nr:hypothetical protein [Nitrospirota bacterium]